MYCHFHHICNFWRDLAKIMNAAKKVLSVIITFIMWHSFEFQPITQIFFLHKVNLEYCVRHGWFINDYRSSNSYKGHKAPGGCRPLTNPGKLQGSQSIYPAKLVPNHPAPTEFIQLTNFKPQFASNVYYGVLFGQIRWLYFFVNVHDFRLVCFSMESSSWWRYDPCLSGSSLVFQWRDAPLVCDFQMWSHWCQLWYSNKLHGHKMRFCGIW